MQEHKSQEEKELRRRKTLCTKQQRKRGDSGRGQLRKGSRALRSRYSRKKRKMQVLMMQERRT